MDEPVGKRELQKRQTRERLVEVAGELFARQGISATTTAEVAKAAGVSHGTVFAHFPTREELVAEVVARATGEVSRRLHERMGEADLDVRAILQAHLDALAVDEALQARLVMEAPLLPDLARRRLVGVQSALSHHLRLAAEREVAAGRMRSVKPHLLFNTWVGLVNHYLVNRDLFAPGGSVLRSRGPELVDHLLALLSP